MVCMPVAFGVHTNRATPLLVGFDPLIPTLFSRNAALPWGWLLPKIAKSGSGLPTRNSAGKLKATGTTAVVNAGRWVLLVDTANALLLGVKVAVRAWSPEELGVQSTMAEEVKPPVEDNVPVSTTFWF